MQANFIKRGWRRVCQAGVIFDLAAGADAEASDDQKATQSYPGVPLYMLHTCLEEAPGPAIHRGDVGCCRQLWSTTLEICELIQCHLPFEGGLRWRLLQRFQVDGSKVQVSDSWQHMCPSVGSTSVVVPELCVPVIAGLLLAAKANDRASESCRIFSSLFGTPEFVARTSPLS